MKDIRLSTAVVLELKEKIKENDLYIDTLAIQGQELLEEVTRLVALRDKAKGRGNYATAKRHEKRRCMLLDRQARLLDLEINLHLENDALVGRILSSRRASGKTSLFERMTNAIKAQPPQIAIYPKGNIAVMLRVSEHYQNVSVRVEHASHSRYCETTTDTKGFALLLLPDATEVRCCPFVLVHIAYTDNGVNKNQIIYLVPRDTRTGKVWSPIKDGAKHYKRYMGF